MNKAAYSAIEQAWQACVKVRALCPSAREEEIGRTEYESTAWYKKRGATYFVKQPEDPLTHEGLEQLRKMTAFINRSFIIVMAAMLESHGVVPYKSEPDKSLDGGEHVLLVKWLRNRFAHGDYNYNPDDPNHVETRLLLEKLLPITKKPEYSGFPAAIDIILEPLKDGVLRYIKNAG